MDMDQNGSKMAQQGMSIIAQQIAEQEQKAERRVEQAKQIGKQHAYGVAMEKTKPMRDNLISKAVNKMPDGVKDILAKGLDAHSKVMNGIAEKLSGSKLGDAVGSFFAKRGAASKAFSEGLKKAGQKVATKAATTVAAVPTGGASLAAQAATEVGSKAAEAAKKAKDVADAKKDTPAQEKLDDKLRKAAEKMAPGVGKLQGAMTKSNQKKDEQDKDYNMAIFSGTKDMMGKVGLTKPMDLTK